MSGCRCKNATAASTTRLGLGLEIFGRLRTCHRAGLSHYNECKKDKIRLVGMMLWLFTKVGPYLVADFAKVRKGGGGTLVLLDPYFRSSEGGDNAKPIFAPE
jgi:hypothetical protein